MLQHIENIDREITITINNLSHNYLDYIMIFLSNKYVWIPLYIYLIFLLWKYDKKNFIINVVICSGAVIIADFITSSLMKPYFERLRPCQDNSMLDLINIVSGCGKKFSFASSHASTTFSLATIFFYVTRGDIKLLFLWSFLIGYSRIYLGVHYFLDVIIGFLVGFLTSVVIYRISKKYLA